MDEHQSITHQDEGRLHWSLKCEKLIGGTFFHLNKALAHRSTVVMDATQNTDVNSSYSAVLLISDGTDEEGAPCLPVWQWWCHCCCSHWPEVQVNVLQFVKDTLPHTALLCNLVFEALAWNCTAFWLIPEFPVVFWRPLIFIS